MILSAKNKDKTQMKKFCINQVLTFFKFAFRIRPWNSIKVHHIKYLKCCAAKKEKLKPNR